MKAQKLIFALLGIALLFSCSDENSFGSNSEIAEANNLLAKQNALKYDNRISMEEAMKYVESATAFLNKEDNSELGLKRSVKSASKASSTESVYFLFFEKSKPSLLKSDKNANFDISDTLAYVFNFNDSLGSVIVAYDKRVENPLLAFTEKGFIGDKIDNPGLRIFLERAEDYILNSIAETEERKDSMFVGVLCWICIVH